MGFLARIYGPNTTYEVTDGTVDAGLTWAPFPQPASLDGRTVTLAALALDQWAHVVFVRSSSQFSLYVNGVLAGSSAGTFPATAFPSAAYPPVFIGASPENDAFVGLVDDLVLYDGALLAADVTALYSSSNQASNRFTVSGSALGIPRGAIMAITVGNGFELGTNKPLITLSPPGDFSFQVNPNRPWKVDIAIHPVGLTCGGIRGVNTGAAQPGQDIGCRRLVGDWTFEGGLQDSSGFGHHGLTPSGGAAIVSDPERGSVLSLPTTTAQVVVADTLMLSHTGPYTISCWFKMAAFPTAPNGVIFNHFNGAPDGGFGLRVYDDGVGGALIGSTAYIDRAAAGTWMDSPWAAPPAPLLLNAWYHAAVVNTGTGFRVYLDGSLVASSSGVITEPVLPAYDTPLYFGFNPTARTSFLGFVDDLRFWHGSLSATQVKAEYQRRPTAYTVFLEIKGLTSSDTVALASSAGTMVVTSPTTRKITQLRSGQAWAVTVTSQPASGAVCPGVSGTIAPGTNNEVVRVMCVPKLVLWLKFDGDLTDSSGFGHNITLSTIGATLATSTERNSYANLATNMDSFRIPSTPALSSLPGGARSLSAWFRLAAPSPLNNGFIFNKFSATTCCFGYGLRLFHPSGGLQTPGVFDSTVGGGGVFTVGPQPASLTLVSPSPSEWHHVCVVDDGSSMSWWLDGVLIKSGSSIASQYASSTADLFIGYQPTDGHFGFVGDLDDLKIWAGALSPEQVVSEYQATRLLPVQLHAVGLPSGSSVLVTPLTAGAPASVSEVSGTYAYVTRYTSASNEATSFTVTTSPTGMPCTVPSPGYPGGSSTSRLRGPDSAVITCNARVGSWTFDYNTIQDSVGTAHGTGYSNGAALASDPVRGAVLSLPNGNSYVTLATAGISAYTAGFDAAGAFTASAWINPSVFPVNHQGYIFSKFNHTASKGYGLRFNTGQGALSSATFPEALRGYGVDYDGSQYFASAIQLGKWYHVAVSFDHKVEAATYINGVLVATRGQADISSSPGLAAGDAILATLGTPDNIVGSFQGLVDDVTFTLGVVGHEMIKNEYLETLLFCRSEGLADDYSFRYHNPANEHCYVKMTLPDWQSTLGGSAYATSFDQARDACRAVGGDLVEISDENEEKVVLDLIGTMGPQPTVVKRPHGWDMWIGHWCESSGPSSSCSDPDSDARFVGVGGSRYRPRLVDQFWIPEGATSYLRLAWTLPPVTNIAAATSGAYVDSSNVSDPARNPDRLINSEVSGRTWESTTAPAEIGGYIGPVSLSPAVNITIVFRAALPIFNVVVYALPDSGNDTVSPGPGVSCAANSITGLKVSLVDNNGLPYLWAVPAITGTPCMITAGLFEAVAKKAIITLTAGSAGGRLAEIVVNSLVNPALKEQGAMIGGLTTAVVDAAIYSAEFVIDGMIGGSGLSQLTGASTDGGWVISGATVTVDTPAYLHVILARATNLFRFDVLFVQDCWVPGTPMDAGGACSPSLATSTCSVYGSVDVALEAYNGIDWVRVGARTKSNECTTRFLFRAPGLLAAELRVVIYGAGSSAMTGILEVAALPMLASESRASASASLARNGASATSDIAPDVPTHYPYKALNGEMWGVDFAPLVSDTFATRSAFGALGVSVTFTIELAHPSLVKMVRIACVSLPNTQQMSASSPNCAVNQITDLTVNYFDPVTGVAQPLCPAIAGANTCIIDCVASLGEGYWTKRIEVVVTHAAAAVIRIAEVSVISDTDRPAFALIGAPGPGSPTSRWVGMICERPPASLEVLDSIIDLSAPTWFVAGDVATPHTVDVFFGSDAPIARDDTVSVTLNPALFSVALSAMTSSDLGATGDVTGVSGGGTTVYLRRGNGASSIWRRGWFVNLSLGNVRLAAAVPGYYNHTVSMRVEVGATGLASSKTSEPVLMSSTIRVRGLPTITAISGAVCSLGPAMGGTNITVLGSDFGPPSAWSPSGLPAGSIRLGGTLNCSSVTAQYINDSRVACTVPPSVPGVARENLTLSLAVNGYSSSSTTLFNCSYSAPAVTAVVPALFSVTGAQPVTILGTDFGPGGGGTSAVAAGVASAGSGFSAPLVNCSGLSDTAVVCSTPPGGGSGLHVSITVSSQRSPATPVNTLFSYRAPNVTFLNGNPVPAAGGPITLLGSEFASSPAPTVSVGGSVCASPTRVTDTQITCTAPAGSGVAVNVAVTTHTLVSPAAALLNYVVVVGSPPGPPTLLSCVPSLATVSAVGLSFAAPVNSTVTAYTVTANGSPAYTGLNTTVQLLGPYPRGVPVTLSVTASNGFGTGNASATLACQTSPRSNSSLASLACAVPLSPPFSPAVTAYSTAPLDPPIASLVCATATPADAAAAVLLPPATPPLPLGTSTVSIVVTAQDGVTTTTYSIQVVNPARPGPVAAPTFALAGTAIAVSWAAPASNPPVANYTVFRNGTAVGTVTALTFSDATVAASTTYEYGIMASNAYGDSTVQNNASFAAAAPRPVVTAVAPASGPAAGGAVVTIFGSFLGIAQGDLAGVTFFGTVAAVSFTWLSSASVLAIAPAAAGTPPIQGPVTVTVRGGVSSAPAATYTAVGPGPAPPTSLVCALPSVGFLLPSAPLEARVTIAVAAAPATVLQTIVVPGGNFTGSVAFAAALLTPGETYVVAAVSQSVTTTVPVPVVQESSPAANITCLMPSLAPAAASAPAAGSPAGGIVFGAAPVVVRATPSAGPQSGGTVVTISGSSLGSSVADIQDILLDGVSCKLTKRFVSSAAIVCTSAPAPATTTAAGGVVTVKTLVGVGSSPAGVFSYTSAAPVVLGFSPQVVSPTGGTTLTITGSYFSPSLLSVLVAGASCLSPVYVSASVITCITPPQNSPGYDPTQGILVQIGALASARYWDPAALPAPSSSTSSFVARAAPPPGFSYGTPCQACLGRAICVAGACDCPAGFTDVLSGCATPIWKVSPVKNNEPFTNEDRASYLGEVALSWPVGLSASAGQVVVTVSLSDPKEAVVTPKDLVFPPGAASTALTFTVTGANDGLRDGNTSYVVGFAVTSPSPPAAIAAADFELRPVVLTNNDSLPTVVRLKPAVSPLLGINITMWFANVDPAFSVLVGGRPARILQNVTASSRRLAGLQAAASDEQGFLVELPAGTTVEYAPVTIVNAGGGQNTMDKVLYYTDDCPKEGWYGRGLQCKECPAQAECPGGYRLWPKEGFWTPGESAGYVVACEPPDACLGGQTSQCRRGNTGTFCASCLKGYFNSNGLCEPCPSRGGLVIKIGALVGLWVLFGICVVAIRDRITLSYVVMAFKALQMLAGIGKSSTGRLPKWLRTLYAGLR
jgi:hypothetical protein